MKFTFSFLVVALLFTNTLIAQYDPQSEEAIREAQRFEKCKSQFLNEEYQQVLNYYDSIRPQKNFLRFEMYQMASVSCLKLAENPSNQIEYLTKKSQQAYNDALRWYGSMKIKEWDEPQTEVLDEPEEMNPIDEQPGPVGGMAAFYKYVGQEMRYPEMARRMGIEGIVFAQFVVNKDGSIDAINIIKGIGGGCDEEVVRILQNAANWNPGKLNGEPTYVRMILPFTFKLN